MSAQPRSWWLPSDTRYTGRRFRPDCSNLTRSAYGGDIAVRPGLVRTASGGYGSGAVLKGHFAVYDRGAKISDRSGPFMERIAPGAFGHTIAANRDSIRCLFQHGKDPFIGERPLGPITVLREDDHGCYYECALLDTAATRELIPGLAAGLYGASFRFSVDSQRITDRPQRSAYNRDGLPERTITAANVREIGPCVFPAYSAANASVSQPATPMLAAASSHPRHAPRRSRRHVPPSWIIR